MTTLLDPPWTITLRNGDTVEAANWRREGPGGRTFLWVTTPENTVHLVLDSDIASTRRASS